MLIREDFSLVFFFIGNDLNGSITLSQLPFVDDTIIFYDANHDQIESLRIALLCFKVVLGLKLNLDKSELVPVERGMKYL